MWIYMYTYMGECGGLVVGESDAWTGWKGRMVHVHGDGGEVNSRDDVGESMR